MEFDLVPVACGEKDAKCNFLVLGLTLSNSEPISLKIRFVGHALQNAHDASNHSAGRRGRGKTEDAFLYRFTRLLEIAGPRCVAGIGRRRVRDDHT